MQRENQRDLSTAVMAGWRAAQGEILGCMDGDLQHPPELLPSLVQRLRETHADVVVDSRAVDRSGVSEWNFRRRIISWTATLLARLLLPGKVRSVRDPMSGFFLLHRAVIEEVELNPLGYKILLEVLSRGDYARAEGRAGREPGGQLQEPMGPGRADGLPKPAEVATLALR